MLCHLKRQGDRAIWPNKSEKTLLCYTKLKFCIQVKEADQRYNIFELLITELLKLKYVICYTCLMSPVKYLNTVFHLPVHN